MSEWMSELPAELQSAESLKQFKSVEDLAKSYIETKAAVGSSIRIPAADAGEDARVEFITKLRNKVPELVMRPADDDQEAWSLFGKPDKSDEYQIPEGVTLPDGSEEAIRAMMFDANLTKRQAEQFLRSMGKKGAEVTQTKADAALAEEKALRAEWGATYDQRMVMVGKIREQFGIDGDAKKLYGIAERMLSGKAEMSLQPETSTAMTPAEAKRQIEEIENNPEYWDRKNPVRQNVLIKRRLELARYAYPEMSHDPTSLRSA
jgi:hypothetical protein